MEITEDLKKRVWNQAREAEGYDKQKVRLDACKAFMIFDEYGKQGLYGWQIDHVCPVSMLEELGYTEKEIDNEQNLRAMHWRNNLSKSDDYPSYTSVITSDGDRNVEREESKIVNALRQQKLQSLYPKLKKN